MRRAILVWLVGASFLLIATAGVRAAGSDEPLQCAWEGKLDTSDPKNPHWDGIVTGDIQGTIVVTPQTAWFPGKTEHFTEISMISTGNGEFIKVADGGVYNFPTLKFRMNGWVIDASPGWAYLDGYKFHQIGATGEFPPATVTASFTLEAP